MKKYIFYLLFILSIIVTLILVVFWGWNLYQIKRDKYLRGDNIAYPESFDLDETTAIKKVFFDFSKEIGTGSPLIFGGSNPRIKQESVWSDFDLAGINAVRVPLFVEHSVTSKTTIADYLENKNNVQNPKKWNQEVMNRQTLALKNAHSLGMKTLGVMELSPAWLSASSTPSGVPMNWQIYQDIVQKMYATNRDYLDYIEIWNEPDFGFFLNLSGTTLSREDAYIEIFMNAAQAIRKYDNKMADGKKVKIGGPALSKLENTSILKKMLTRPDVMEYVDFISVHNYDNHSELDILPIKDIIKNSNTPNIPLFLTEWSYSSDSKEELPQLVSEESIPYVGNQFIRMFQQNIAAGFFFALQPVERVNLNYGHGYLAYYEMINNQPILLPVAKTWQLFSKTMKLGEGENKIFYSSLSNDPNIITLKNSHNENVLLAVNPSYTKIEYDITINMDSSHRNYSIDTYVASQTLDPNEKISSLSLKAADGSLSFKIILPPQSTGGFIIREAQGLIL